MQYIKIPETDMQRMLYNVSAIVTINILILLVQTSDP